MTFRVQPHMRLQEWVADELGFLGAEGLDYEFQTDGFSSASTASVVAVDQAPQEVRSGAFEDMEAGRACSISAACHWAVNAAAAAGHGKMWGAAYSVCPSGILVAPESQHTKPEDLRGVEVGVGYHSGSHYSAVQALQPFLDGDTAKLAFVGRPYDRVRLMAERQIEAANVFGAQFYLLEQLGFRKLVDTTFVMGFLVAEDAEREDLERYFRALRQAQRAIDLEPERFKHYWLREMPEDLQQIADVRRFGPGERVVFEPYTREMYETTQRWMRANDLFAEVDAALGYQTAVLA
jgi:NitT/TauT family transport system substrate-binding protein